ncbi:MAG: KamA family radical SAM protein, partial [Kiritimatiellae bacterium]|nr:KamA family radical SAM protein [Kiritimatiellia bacterium]
MSSFPEYACAYAKNLAAVSPRFARQCRASGQELKELPEHELADPFGELTHAGRCPGLKQRFPDRVLIMTCDRCFMNCRHCT